MAVILQKAQPTEKLNQLKLWWNRYDLAAVFAGPKFLVLEKSLIGVRYRVLGVVAHDEGFFVDQIIALGAVPVESVYFAGAPFAL